MLKRSLVQLLLCRGRSLRAKISGGRGRPWGIFFGFYKTRHILLSDSANGTVLHAVVLTQYRRVTDGQTDRQTDGQTDGNAIASTALAMRAMRSAVKTKARFSRLLGHPAWKQRGRIMVLVLHNFVTHLVSHLLTALGQTWGTLKKAAVSLFITVQYSK